jgi:predicted Zn finger-like uncharacterized protein
MKITCHSCQSKYNVADEKVQGKTVKIRCKKCGATLVISADGVQANGVSAPTPAVAEDRAADQITFTVNVAEGDQRSMTIEEIVVAYNDGTVTQETFLWADGMTDWLPLAQVESIVAALHSAASAPLPAADEAPQYAAPPAYDPPPAYAAAPAFDPAPAPAAEERRAARREGARGTRDLFAAQPSGDDGLSASAASAFAPPPGGGGGNGASGGAMTTGARNENSVLFSLAVLTKDEAPAPSPMGSVASAASKKEDSGLIDLKALSLAAAATSGASPELAAPLFAPSAPFGSFDSPALPLGGSIAPDAQPKNKMMLIVAAAAVVVALGAIIALVLVMKSGGKNDTTAASASASASATPEIAAPASAEPPPTVSVAAASSAPADSSSATVAATKPKPGAKPIPGVAVPGVKPTATAAAATTTAPAVKKPGGDCGCAGDLMCLMKCRSGH